ncbi:MAG: hypothetical protein WDM89_17685 [Rhizomicrobium sp.]
MTNVGFFDASVKIPVSDSAAASFTVDAPQDAQRHYHVISDVIVYLSRVGDATTDSMRLPADQPIRFSAMGGDVISVLGDSSGSIWLTLIA